MVPQESSESSWRFVVATFGLPAIIGVAAIDPGNLEVDLQAGAGLGYKLLWSLLLASVLGSILQALAAHLTIVTGSDLAKVCGTVYRRDLVLQRFMFVVTELSIIAFDVAEVIGTAFGLRLLLNCPLWAGMLLSAFDTLLVILLQRAGLSRVEMIVEGLLLILSLSLVYEFVLSKPDVGEMAKGALLPSFGEHPGRGVVLAISIMGSVIMSHNLFLHSWLVRERQTSPDNALRRAPLSRTSVFNRAFSATALKEECRYAGFESACVFLSTFLVNSCVVVVAANLPQDAIAKFSSFGLQQAGALLHNIFGAQHAAKVWAVALLASGHAATVTGTLSSQAVCEGFLNIRPGTSSNALVFATRVVAIVPAVGAALLAGERGSDNLAVMSQAVLSFALPFAAVPLFCVLEAVSHATGEYKRGLLRAGYAVFSLMMAANGFALWQVGAAVQDRLGSGAAAAFGLLVAGGLGMLVRVARTPVNVGDLSDLDDGLASDGEHAVLLTQKTVDTESFGYRAVADRDGVGKA